MSPETGKIVQFGPFEANLQTSELRKHGIRVRLGGQPSQILAALLERPGEIVTREELRGRLWPDQTFVEFETGLNSAVRKLRMALGDPAGKAVYVETLPRMGYRFVAPIQHAGNGAGPARAEATVQGDAGPTLTKGRAWNRQSWVAAAAVLVTGFVAYGFLSPVPVPHVTDFLQTPLTDHFDGFGRIVTDGTRVYFLERAADHDNLVQSSTAGNATTRIDTPFRNTRIFEVSHDASEFLIGNFTTRRPGLPLWIWPVQGGSPLRVGNVVVDDAAWTPDGQQIIYTRGNAIHVVRRDGSGDRILLHTSGYTYGMEFSPDGRRFAFSVVTRQSDSQALWEASADGSDPHVMFPGWSDPPSECCGQWTPDGKYFVFSSHHSGSFNMYAVRQSRFALHWRKPAIVQLASTAREIGIAALARNGTRAFVSSANESYEMLRYDPMSRQFTPIPEARDAVAIRSSADGSAVVVQKMDWTLWRVSKKSGPPIQLTTAPLRAAQAVWSPDGSKIAFEAALYGKPTRAYVVNANGGAIEEVLAQEGAQGVPAWSPDGTQIAVAVNWSWNWDPLPATSKEPRGIYLVNPSTGKAAKVPRSDGLTSPMWSPNGKYFTAKSADESSILLFDAKARQWKVIAKGAVLSGLTWSKDSKYLFVQRITEDEQPVYRLKAGTFKPERVVDCRSLLAAGAETCVLQSTEADGSLVFRLENSGGQVYALDLAFP